MVYKRNQLPWFLGLGFLAFLGWLAYSPPFSAKAHTPLGIDLSPLFIPPTAGEKTVIQEDWASRQHTVINWQTVVTGTILTDYTAAIFSHEVEGETHYGAVRYPHNYQPGGSYPVLVYLHKGIYNVFLDGELLAFDDLFPTGCVEDNFFYVVPSFRGEELITILGIGLYESEGESDPLDTDVDDTITFLNGALAAIPEMDESKIAAIGVSRGGGAALLMGLRDSRVKLLVDYFGPTDLTLPYIQEAVQEWADTGVNPYPDNPVIEGVMIHYITPYLKGEFSLQETRLHLFRSSPAYFASTLPTLQMHHWIGDTVVPIDHSDKLESVLQGLGGNAPAFEYFRYTEGDHNPVELDGSGETIEDFLCTLLPQQQYLPFIKRP